MMLDPGKPEVRGAVLDQCYVLNGPEAQARFRALGAAEMHRLLRDRTHLERRVSAAVNALEAAWRRLQLLAQAVREQGAVLGEPQLAKERELLVGLMQRVREEAEPLLGRVSSRAAALGDLAFLERGPRLRALLRSTAAAAEAYLREHLRRIAAASRINGRYRQAWAAAPEASRPPLHVLEAQRARQLEQLQALAPDHPTQLVGEYRQAALQFQGFQDKALSQRKAPPGLPSSAGGHYSWRQVGDGAGGAAGAPLYGGSSEQGPQPQRQEAGDGGGPAPPGGGQPTPRQAEQQPWAPSGVAWQQHPQQLMARPVQQLPLLPHLAWHRQWLEPPPAAAVAAEPEGERHQQAALRAGAPPQDVSLSGKVMPPLTVLLQRALELDAELLPRAGRGGARGDHSSGPDQAPAP